MECRMGESDCSRNSVLLGGGGSKGDSMIGVIGLCDAQAVGTCVFKLGMRGRPREDVRASMIDVFLERWSRPASLYKRLCTPCSEAAKGLSDIQYMQKRMTENILRRTISKESKDCFVCGHVRLTSLTAVLRTLLLRISWSHWSNLFVTDHFSLVGEISSDPGYKQRTISSPKQPMSSGIADSLQSSALSAALFSDIFAQVLDESLDRPNSESTSSSLHQFKS